MKALLFKIGAETFALDFKQIQKVVDAPDLCGIPLAPPFFLGAMNFHNQIVPVLDLAAYLDIVVQDQDPRVIILELSQYAMAFSVGSIEKCHSLEDVKDLPCHSNSKLSAVSRLVALENGQPIRILEPARLQKRLASEILSNSGKAWYSSRYVQSAEDQGGDLNFDQEAGQLLVSNNIHVPSEPQRDSR